MGRLPVNDQASYELERLWGVHKEILRRHYLGQKSINIARALGVTPTMVSYTINCELGQRFLARMEQEGHANIVDISERLSEMSPQALGVIEETINDPDESKKLRTELAKDVLDRAGYSPVKKFQGHNVTALITSDDLAEMKERVAKQHNGNGGNVVEAEVLEEDNE